MLWLPSLLIFTPGAESGLPFPVLVYTAPNALFLLAAFFLLVRFEEYRPYTHLYMAGKVVAITANIGWLFSSLKRLSQDMAALPVEAISAMGLLLLFAGLDLLTVFGMAALAFGNFISAGPKKPGAAEAGPADSAGPLGIE
jgi:hypothetical protein